MAMQIIELDSWPRKDSFEFFKTYQDPQFSICANVTITRAYEFFQAHGISRFIGMLWLISDAANAIEEIRCRIRGEDVVVHQRVHPSFTWLKDDKTLTFCQAEYVQDVATFFRNVQKSIAGVEPNPGVADKKETDDVLYISCVPWINFTSVTHPFRTDDTRSIPRITWGKFFKDRDQWLMPVSIQLHHGLADGYHIGLFLEHLQAALDQPENIDWPV
jgi:chloramphenicol O-acetyltransferase type A